MTGTGGGRVDRLLLSGFRAVNLHRRRVPDSRSCSHHHVPGISVCHLPRHSVQAHAVAFVECSHSISGLYVWRKFTEKVVLANTSGVTRLLESRSEQDRGRLPNPDSMTQGLLAETLSASQRRLQPRISPLTPVVLRKCAVLRKSAKIVGRSRRSRFISFATLSTSNTF